MTTIYHYHHPAPWKKHIIWKHIEISNIFFNIPNLPTYQVFSISVNGAPSLHLLRPKTSVSSLTHSSLMCHIQHIKKSHWLCFQNIASIRPVLKASSSQAQATIIYVLNYCSSVSTGLRPLVFLLVGLLFIQRPMILLIYSRSNHFFPQNLLISSHLTLSQSQHTYNRQHGPTEYIIPSPSAFSLKPFPVALPLSHFTSATLVSTLFA